MIEFIKRLFKYNKEFYPYEQCVINSISESLDVRSRMVFQEQLRCLKMYKRNFSGKEVVFCLSYLKDYKRYAHLDEKELRLVLSDQKTNDNYKCFECLDEAELLRFTLLRIDNRDKMKVDLMINNGEIDRLLFHKAPSKFFKGIPLSKAIPHISEAKLLRNPMIASNELSNEIVKPETLSGWVKSCYDRRILINLRPPLEPNELKSFIDGFDTKFPDDYIEFLHQADYGEFHLEKNVNDDISTYEIGTMANVIKGMRTYEPIIRAVGDKCLYYMIADISIIGAIVMRAGDYSGEVVLIKYDDGDWETPLNTSSFVEAINKVLELVYKKCEVSLNDQVFI